MKHIYRKLAYWYHQKPDEFAIAVYLAWVWLTFAQMWFLWLTKGQ